mgnify:CR=1 FL=1
MMKKYLIILFTNVLISQNFNENFLDGTIMFKLNDYVEYSGESVYKTNDGIGLIDNLSNYPEINSVFQNINVLQFERPSYFTNKRELQKIYRIKFDDFDKIDLLIKKLNDLESIEYAEKEPIYRTTFVPNDSYHWGNNKWYHTLVNSEQAWDISLGNEKVKTIRFIASVDNELMQMENVFKLINVKLNSNELERFKEIKKNNYAIDPDSDEFFRSLKTRINLLSIYKDALQNIPLKPPMEHYYVSSPYGPRKHPVTGKYRMHHGIDLAGTWQENVSVSADGTVVFAGYHGSFGKVIRIRHDYGIMTTYGHLAKISVRRGDLVNEGQVIGKMGRTGKVKGAHLHYEISVNGKSQNPATYIKIGRNLLSRTSLKSYANKNLN